MNLTQDQLNEADKKFKEWAKDKFSSASGRALFNYGGNTDYALARHLFAELLTNSDAEPVLWVSYATTEWFGKGNGIVEASLTETEHYKYPMFRASHSKAEQDAELISLLKDVDLVCPSSAGFDGRDTFFACGECSTCKLIALTKG